MEFAYSKCERSRNVFCTETWRPTIRVCIINLHEARRKHHNTTLYVANEWNTGLLHRQHRATSFHSSCHYCNINTFLLIEFPYPVTNRMAQIKFLSAEMVEYEQLAKARASFSIKQNWAQVLIILYKKFRSIAYNPANDNRHFTN
jgi:hypothetical protein